MRVFVAGATGAIGRVLVPILVVDGHRVTGMTRRPERAAALERSGARAVLADAYDRAAVVDAVVASGAEVVIDQLTDLTSPSGGPLDDALLERNARLRVEGTANLVEAAAAAGARRVIAQSIAFVYAPGPEPHRESDPLLPVGPGASPTMVGIQALERLVTTDPRFDGVVLRYGRLYGDGTWARERPEPPSVSVEGAARAAVLAVTRGSPGIYNIVDDGGPAANERARRELGWAPDGDERAVNGRAS